MEKSVYIVLLLVVTLGLGACHRGGYEEVEAASTDPVILNIKVNLSDLLPKTRAGEELAENEKIQTLRVIVVNSHNDVEGNVLVDLEEKGENFTTEYSAVSIRNVKSNDTKMIYLIANEGTEKVATIAGETERRKLVDYNFNNIIAGAKFPTNDIFNLKINLDYNSDQLASEQLTGALPMSEWHRIKIPPVSLDDENSGFFILTDEDKEDFEGDGEIEIYGYRQTLWITRSAVKFTYHFINETNQAITIHRLEMDKMAKCEYFIPRVLERGEENEHEITQFAVPTELTNNNGYYTFKLDSDEFPLFVNAKGEALLKPIYLLEGKFTDSDSESENLNYKVSLSVDQSQGQVTLSDYLPNLSQLPRNTHVVVDVTFKGANIVWEVHVHPYISVPLEPDFGL